VACGGCWCFRPFGQTLRLRLMPETVCHATYVVSRQRWVHGEGGSIATHHTDWRHGDQQWKQGCKRRSNISSEDLKWSNALGEFHTRNLGEFLVPLKRILSHAWFQFDNHLQTFHVAKVPYDTEETMRPSYINSPSKQQQVHTMNDWMNDGTIIMQTVKKIVQSNYVDQIFKLWFLVVML